MKTLTHVLHIEYIAWLGMVDCPCPSQHFVPENPTLPFSVATPPPSCLPGRMCGGWSNGVAT
jgi:hypothetical protein